MVWCACVCVVCYFLPGCINASGLARAAKNLENNIHLRVSRSYYCVTERCVATGEFVAAGDQVSCRQVPCRHVCFVVAVCRGCQQNCPGHGLVRRKGAREGKGVHMKSGGGLVDRSGLCLSPRSLLPQTHALDALSLFWHRAHSLPRSIVESMYVTLVRMYVTLVLQLWGLVPAPSRTHSC